MPSIIEFEASMLALLMWSRNGPDGLQGMVAVGLVVGNRVHSGWNGGDWCEVLGNYDTFEAMVSDSLIKRARLPMPDVRNPSFQAVLKRAGNIREGTEPDITGGALYLANLGADAPISKWFLENIVRKPESHPRIGTVGRYTLFA